VRTEPTTADVDDPAIWVNKSNPAASLVLGTRKAAAPEGAVVVYGLDGGIRQIFANLDRPNNIDIEGDLAVVTERNRGQIRAFQVSDAGLRDLGGVPVFEGETGANALPMGIAVYRRPRDGALFAIVSRKSGPSGRYLWQYRLTDHGGRITAVRVREFGLFSGGADNEIEAVAVDDAAGHVYYADEAGGIRKYHADPDRPGAAEEIALFGRDGFRANREGIALLPGVVICTDQIAGNSRYLVFSRRAPHALLRIVEGGADSTDGIEATSANLGPRFPRGLVVAMNSSGRNFMFFRAESFLP